MPALRIVACAPWVYPLRKDGPSIAFYGLVAHLRECGARVQVSLSRGERLRPSDYDRIGEDGRAQVVLGQQYDGIMLARYYRGEGVPIYYYAHQTRDAETLRRRGDLGKVRVIYNSPHAASEAEAEAPGQLVVTPYLRPEFALAPDVDHWPSRTTYGTVNSAPAKGGHLFARLVGDHPELPFSLLEGAYGHQLPTRDPSVLRVPNLLRYSHGVPVRIYHRQVRTLLCPSLTESFGLAAVEAMSVGIPVIASDLPTLRASLGPAEFLPCAPPSAVASRWVDAIRADLDDDTLHRHWSEAVREFALSTYSLSRYRARVRGVYETMLADVEKAGI